MDSLDNNELNESAGVRAVGHVLIRNKESGEVLVDKNNAIHFENFSQALALSIANRSSGYIFMMVFGNGGSVSSDVGVLSYLPPNSSGLNATLYNQTYAKIVDDLSPLNTDAANNYVRVSHVAGVLYTDVQITCTLEFNEPSGQLAFDNATQANNNGTNNSVATYIFDELGLQSYSNATGEPGMLLSHVIFFPVQKALNVSIEVIYTIRISLS